MASFPIGSHYDQVHLGNEEMLKGVIDRALSIPYANTQTVIVPVIENAPSEGCPEVGFSKGGFEEREGLDEVKKCCLIEKTFTTFK